MADLYSSVITKVSVLASGPRFLVAELHFLGGRSSRKYVREHHPKGGLGRRTGQESILDGHVGCRKQVTISSGVGEYLGIQRNWGFHIPSFRC